MAFRRVAYHRSWFMIGVGAIALASIVGNWIAGERLGTDLHMLAAIGAIVSVLILVRGLTGAWGRQLRIDVAGGKLMLPDGSTHDLDAIGELILDSKLLPRSNNPEMRNTRFTEYRLRAANVDYYLFISIIESETKLRHDAIDAAILQYRLRRVLERPDGEGAFRSAPDASAEVLEIAGTRERALAAFEALAKSDPDRQIRARAQQQLVKS